MSAILSDEVVEAACLGYWPLHWKEHIAESDKPSIRRHMRNALLAALPHIREACARTAEERHKHWRMPHPDDAAPFEVCDDVSACRDIATAIRAATKEGSSP